MAQLTATAMDEILRTEHLHKAVEEVFGLMLGVECHPADACPQEAESITAMIGLAGVLGGVCVLRSGRSVALKMAECLAGMPFDEVDATVKDAIGEVSNMLAGAWKSRLAELSSACMLSVPAVVSGRDYGVYLQDPLHQLGSAYQFGTWGFTFNILIERVG